MKICFLGAGAFGTALSNIAKENGHEVNFYDPIKFPDVALSDATKDSTLAVYTAPANKFADILPDLPKDLPLICASKGFLSLKPFAGFKDFTALGGAGFATDINKLTSGDEPSSSTSSAQPKITFTTSSTMAEHVFSTEDIHVEYTDDTLGIMLCGAMKNIYAVGAGFYSENGITTNIDYLQKSAKEIQSILKENNAKEDTLQLSCGISDLLLSCSKDSRNFRYGYAIKSGQPPEDATVEGLTVINSIADFPEFIVPNTATIFQDIVTRIKNNAAQ